MSSLPAPRPATAAAALQPAASTITYFDREVRVPPSAHTLAGFRAWATSDDFPERGRISFLQGEIFIDLSPEELQTHVKVKLEVTRGLENLNRKRRLGEVYPDGCLLTHVEADLFTEPDAGFAKWSTLESGRLRLIPRESAEDQGVELQGTPDLVVEIVSDSSVRKDRRRLREAYHRAGIPEYWLIDCRGDQIDFELLVREEADYAGVSPRRGGWLHSPLFHRLFRLTRRRVRLGRWQYTLQVKTAR